MPVCEDCGEDDPDESYVYVDGETRCLDCAEEDDVSDIVEAMDGEVEW